MTRRRDLIGTIRSITYPGAGRGKRVTAYLELDEGPIVLYFMSRSNLECIDIGSKVRVIGAVSTYRGVPTMFNPSYTVVEDSDEHA
ncbi:OB-fold nucleic acid binding domain-containing protein [Trueperella pecoris]|uniref:OB-fold nucleic acid binding domain-containing protein n=1 Tax=Trueperella pecoris TaxID=2733571 RepID=A0A7M1R310_9ACTO|nr:OB-fold nucleic acid binding domain-containing protein [Trueperella pecoris]QOQ38909.1 OB-fold nucleic acid binding domain-containing protein [Trueperella pecoris]QOR46463.1 OB-fold nucleic acid binding domain-containing protein [Trueperella pecoris]QOR48533.1 OB-fold nucleic acid binding domain-containing protein [Trueperella pecoris]QTG76289.1 OB-fold nucleic acid binding domain-containing protein [Trueperella pecoris]